MKLNVYEAANFMGVELTITVDALKSKYKELARIYHPDISSLPNAIEMMQKLNVSFELLQDKVPINGTKHSFTGSTTDIHDDSDWADVTRFNFGWDRKKFANQNEFFDAFFKNAFNKNFKRKVCNEDFQQQARNAGKTGKPKPYWTQDNQSRSTKTKNNQKVTIQVSDGRVSVTHTVGLDGVPTSVSLPNTFRDIAEAQQFADTNIFKENITPPAPKQAKNEWKRSTAGNKWKAENGTNVIIFPDKKNNGIYKVMSITNNEKKYYQDTFTNEEAAMVYAERFIFGNK
jgi:curved DNA-binding protein CbpA